MPDFKLLEGDCIKVMQGLPENSVDSIVTDPPYGLEFMGKEWDAPWKSKDVRQPDDENFTKTDNAYGRSKVRYAMGSSYGGGNEAMVGFQEWYYAVAKEMFRVLKPGGHVLSFGGSRTYHRMACAIEDAGFEVRDQIMWVYGSGFPKSHNISKAMDKNAGVEPQVIGRNPNSRENSTDSLYDAGTIGKTAMVTAPSSADAKRWEGWGTALKPAHEPIVLARKPFNGTVAENVLKWGTGGLNIDGCRVANNGEQFGELPNRGGRRVFNTDGQTFQESGYDYKEGDLNAEAVAKLKALGRFPANLMHDNSQEVLDLFPSNAGAAAPVKSGHSGESNGIYNDYAQRGDDGATFYADKGSAARFFFSPKEVGRFPANLMHDGSQEVQDLFPYSKSTGGVNGGKLGERTYGKFGNETPGANAGGLGDEGSAARFFYCPKATKKDRDEGCDELETKEKPAHMRTGNGTGEASMESGWPATQRKNTHPTVKPTELMRYLCRLITPPGGTVLDPFNGSGSTGKAALKEGFNYIGIEKEAEYLRIAEARIRSAL